MHQWSIYLQWMEQLRILRIAELEAQRSDMRNSGVAIRHVCLAATCRFATADMGIDTILYRNKVAEHLASAEYMYIACTESPLVGYESTSSRERRWLQVGTKGRLARWYPQCIRRAMTGVSTQDII